MQSKDLFPVVLAAISEITTSNFSLKKFAFLTVHGAGHEVPAYMPKVALDMWEKYLQGYWTCDGVDENGHNACTLPDAN